MDVVVLLVFVSLVLVAGALVFFVTRLRDGDFDHGDRLSLLPLLDDDGELAAFTPGQARPGTCADSPPAKEDGADDANR